MNKILVALATAVIIFSTACNNERMKMRTHIQELEGKVVKDSSSFTFDDKVRADLAKEQIAYADKFPDDEMAQEYLFKAGGIYIGMNKGKEAITVLDKYITAYPDGKNAGQVMFNKGFVYDTQLKDKAKAVDAYKAFVAKFPNHPLAKDAQFTVNILESGVPEDALIQSFIKKANDSIAAAEGKKVN